MGCESTCLIAGPLSLASIKEGKVYWKGKNALIVNQSYLSNFALYIISLLIGNHH